VPYAARPRLPDILLAARVTLAIVARGTLAP
jgi:hypothetical protein